MAMISLVEYARMHGKEESGMRRKAIGGRFKTAQKIGRNWIIDENEPYEDLRIKTGKRIGEWTRLNKKEPR